MAGRDQLFGQRANGFTGWSRGKAVLDARSRVKNWTTHDIRRSVATRMADLGILPHMIEQILNHQSGHKRGPAGIYNRCSYEREVRARWRCGTTTFARWSRVASARLSPTRRTRPLDAERGPVLIKCHFERERPPRGRGATRRPR